MTFLERIRELCRRDGITVARAEKDLGFSNAYLSQLNPDTIQHGRLLKIADYFGVTPEYLLTGQDASGYYINPETAAAAQEMFENPELRVLFDAARDASPEDLRIVYNLLLDLKRREEGPDEPA